VRRRRVWHAAAGLAALLMLSACSGSAEKGCGATDTGSASPVSTEKQVDNGVAAKTAR
jgi:hypothetical protein